MFFAWVILLGAHLIFANVATGAPFYCIWLLFRAHRNADPLSARLNHQLAVAGIGSLAVAAALGAAVGWLALELYPEPARAAFALLPESRYWFAITEVGFYFVCLIGYLIVCRYRVEYSRVRLTIAIGLAILAGTNLAYHFPTMFAILGAFSTRLTAWGQPVDFVTALLDGEVLALTLHFWLAAAAMSGIALMLLAHRQMIEHPSSNLAPRMVAYGGRGALVASLFQLPGGALLVIQLADPLRERMLGDHPLAAAAFLSGLAATMFLLHKLAAISLGAVETLEVWTATLLIGLVIVLMTAALQLARSETYDHVGVDDRVMRAIRATKNIPPLPPELRDPP